MPENRETVEATYLERLPLLQEMAKHLETEVARMLQGVPHIDRVYFRAKDLGSFADKALAELPSGGLKYAHPFEEVEDQVAGRVLVYFRSDIEVVEGELRKEIQRAERSQRAPAKANEFDYETTHVICAISPDLWIPGWQDVPDMPQTFELQIRTLAQHAWSEPQHEFYKRKGGLSKPSLRKLYWAASSAWGIDSIWEAIQAELSALGTRSS